MLDCVFVALLSCLSAGREQVDSGACGWTVGLHSFSALQGQLNEEGRNERVKFIIVVYGIYAKQEGTQAQREG